MSDLDYIALRKKAKERAEAESFAVYPDNSELRKKNAERLENKYYNEYVTPPQKRF